MCTAVTFAEDVRGRKNLFRIEDQVVFFYGDAVNSVVLTRRARSTPSKSTGL